MVIEKQFINAERFLELVEQPQYEDRIVELVEGELVEMSKASGKHGQITMRLAVLIANHVYANQLGEVTAAETGFVLDRGPDGRDTIRGLDIAYINSSKIPGSLPDSLLDVPPDLAVEIISPSNQASDIHRKVMQLLKASTSLVWIVYPDSKTVTVHAASGATTLHENDTLSGGDVLPGFQIRVGDLFPT